VADKCITDYPNYTISICGVVRNLKTLKVLRPRPKYKKGVLTYYTVVLYDGQGNGKTKSIHRLVAQAFVVNPKNLPMVNHIDGNKLNNHVSNLEWCDGSHNTKHAVDLGLILVPTNNRGEAHTFAKVTEQQVRKIRKAYADGGKTMKEIGAAFGIGRRTVGDIINRTTWKDVI